MAVLVLFTSDLTLRDAWQEELEAQRHTVMLATTTPSAVDRLHEGGVDLVLIDYEAVGGIGRLMVALEKLPDAPPFVLISNAVDAPVLSARLGAAAFVAKPCAADELAAVVARIVRASGIDDVNVVARAEVSFTSSSPIRKRS